jgi:MFS family permease
MDLQPYGGPRYVAATVIDAIGAGLLRPFLVLYAIDIVQLDVRVAGAALSFGLAVGLIALPFVGRWIDRGARSTVVATTLLVRALGLFVLVLAPRPAGFALAVVLLGLGTQVWPAANAALISTLTQGRDRDRALAATRSLRNAGLGFGALIATSVVAAGDGGLRLLAVGTLVGCLVAAALVLGTPAPDSAGPLSASLSGGAPRRSAATGADGPSTSSAMAAGAGLRVVTRLTLLNLPFSLCFDVLEVALPVVLVTGMQVGAAWSAGVFGLNTALVILFQVVLVVRLADRPRLPVLVLSGFVLAASYLGFLVAGLVGGRSGAVLVVVVGVVYTLGEMLYAGSGTALVVALAPAHLLGRALARWQVSMGLGRAVAPVVLTSLLAFDPVVLWTVLAATTVVSALLVRRVSADALSYAGPG